MALLLKNGSVFLHIPKTGGNWVSCVLQDLNLIQASESIYNKHIDIAHYLMSPRYKSKKYVLKSTLGKRLPLTKTKPFMFCFVRNPLSWYESWFKYMSGDNRQWQYWGNEQDICDWHPNSVLNGLGDADFNKFISNVIAKRPGYVTELYGWYTLPQMDFIGKQENLVEDFISVLKKMELDFDENFVRNYEKIGVSDKPITNIIWDKTIKEEVIRCEYAGLLRYGYHDVIDNNAVLHR